MHILSKRQLGRSSPCIARFIRDPGSYRSQPIPGRPRILTAQDNRRIARLVANTSLSVSQIRAQMGLSVSRTTVWRSIRSDEYITRETMKKATRLSTRHKLTRLEFARRNMATSWSKGRLFENFQDFPIFRTNNVLYPFCS